MDQLERPLLDVDQRLEDLCEQTLGLEVELDRRKLAGIGDAQLKRPVVHEVAERHVEQQQAPLL